MRFTKRVLSALLALVMVFTMLPLQVWAEEVGSQDSDNSVNLAGLYGGVKAEEKVAARIDLDAASALLPVGQTHTFTPTLYDENGEQMEGAEYVWASNNTEIATVSGGQVTGVKEGVATITCQYGSLQTEAMVTVTAASYQLTYVIDYPDDAKKFVYENGNTSAIAAPKDTTINFTHAPNERVTIPDNLADTINYDLVAFEEGGERFTPGGTIEMTQNRTLTSVWEKKAGDDTEGKPEQKKIVVNYHNKDGRIPVENCGINGKKIVDAIVSEHGNGSATVTFLTFNNQDTIWETDPSMCGWKINDTPYEYNQQVTVTTNTTQWEHLDEKWVKLWVVDVHPRYAELESGTAAAQFFVRKLNGNTGNHSANYFSVGGGLIETDSSWTQEQLEAGVSADGKIKKAPSITEIANLMNTSVPEGAAVRWYKITKAGDERQDAGNGYHVDGEIYIKGKYWNVRFVDPDSGKVVYQQLVEDLKTIAPENIIDGAGLNTEVRVFKWWSFTKDGEKADLTSPVNQNITLYAVFDRYAGYTVKHLFENLNDYYELGETQIFRASPGSNTAAKAKSVEGFTALAFEQKKVTKDGRTTIEIKYSRNSYDVSYTITGNAQGVTAPKKGNYKFGATVPQEPKLQKEGHSFDGWEETVLDGKSPVAITEGKFTMPARNVTFTGEFTEPYTVTAKIYHASQGQADDSNLLDTKVETTDWDGLQGLFKLTKENLATHFWVELVSSPNMHGVHTWYKEVDGEEVATNDADKNVHNYVVKIYLKENGQGESVIVKLTYDANAGNDTVGNMPNPLSKEYLKGKVVTVASAPERENYTFKGWKDSSDTLHPANSEITLTEDTTLFAVWKQTAKPGTSITVRVVKDGEEDNAEDYVKVIPADGTPSLTVTEGQTHTLNYTYENLDCADFDLSVTVPVGYSVNVTSDKLGPTGTAKLDISGEGKSWRLDNVPGGATVTVRLTKQEFTVKYEASPAEGGTVSRDHETVRYGENAVGATAEPNEGYYFVGWKKDGGEVSIFTRENKPTNVTANATYTAVFARKTEITVKANDLSKEYDGTPITAENATYTANGLLEDYTLDVTYATESAPINVNDTPGTLKIASVTVKNEEGQDVTDQFQITTNTGTLSIKPKPVTVTITGNTDETKTYNGSEQSVVGYEVKIPENSGYSKESITFDGAAIAKGTDVGTYFMDLPKKQFGNNDPNYNVTFKVHDGHLTIGPVTDRVVVTIVGNNNTVTYDGEPHTASGYDVKSIMLGGETTNLYKETDVGLANGATAEITQTNANIGEEKYSMGLTASSFKNNSKNFTNVEFVVTDGYLKINPAEVTVTIKGNQETKTYNGSEQSVETGYTATPSNAQYNTEKITFSGEQTVAGTDHDTYPMGLANNQFSNTDTNYSVTFNVQDGSLTINKLPVTVTAQDINVAYGKPVENLTATKSAADGVEIPDNFDSVVTYTLAHDGGETPNVGEYPIYFKIGEREIKKTETDKDSYQNYEVTFVTGTLTINKAGGLTVSGTDVTKEYNGQSHGVAATASVKEGTTIFYKVGDDGWTTTVPQIMDAGTVTVEVKAENPNYTTATDKYTLKVTPRDVTLTSASDSKTYDGTALTNNTVRVSGDGFVEGEGATYDVTGSQTLVGSSDNTFTYTLNKGTLATNYNIQTVLGTLTVEAPEDFDYVQKKFKGQKFAIGDTVTFTITVTNIYDVPATVVLEEQTGMTFADGKTELTDMLDAGETKTYSVSYEVTEADVEAGQIANKVTWTLTPKDLPEIPGTDEEIIQNPKYKVSYNVSGETPVGYTSPEDADYPIGKSVSVAEMPSYPGYTFTGWTAPEDITVNEGKFAMPEKNVTLTGVFALAGDTKYKVEHYFAKLDGQYPATPKKTENKTGTTFDMTQAQPIPEDQRPGFGVVDSWANEEIKPDGSTVIKIYYNRKEYKISWETSGEPAGQEQTFNPANFVYGADISKVKNPEVEQFDGYTWNGWQIRNENMLTLPGTMPAEDIVITGSYTPIDYEVTYQLAEDSEIPTGYTAPEDNAKYHIGDNVTVKDDARVPGYNFEGWYTEDGNVTADMSTFTMPADNVTLYGKFSKRTDLSYTVKYLWNGTNEEVRPSATYNNGTLDETVQVEVPEVENCTPVMRDGITLTITADAAKNVVNVYYYKNVTLTAESDNSRIYNGELQSLSGYTASVDDLTFSGVREPAASGINADEYTLTFEEDTKGKTDSTGKYIVTAVTPGTLIINKRQVALESESGEQLYNGKALTKPDVKIGDVEFVEEDVTKVKATGTQTLVGESDNTIEITWKDETVAGNYEISTKVGKLIVTAPDNLNDYVAKTHEDQNFKVGDKVTFKISVTNIYAVKATVTLEEMPGMFFGENQTTLGGVLNPGETKIYTATHTLTDADFEKGGVNNTVNVTLTPERGDPTDGTDTDKVVLVKNPDMSVVKTVLNPKESYRVGDTIQYQIIVTNTGNVTLHDLELTDVMNADGKVTFPAGTDLTRKTLNVGDRWTVTCSYVVRAADEGKEISNKATVIAHDPETKDPEKEAGDTTDGEQVQNLYSLTIHYRNGAGNAVAGSYSARYHVGDSFKIDSPIVAGYYDPQIRSISSGANGMPAQDLEYVVIYTAIPVPAPDPGPGPAPNPGPGPGPAPNPGPDDGDDDDDTPPVPDPEQELPPQPQDFEIDPDDYTLTELEDNETPLANLDLDGHTCCILHLLLMLAAMVVLGFYTKSRKKHQARIFELKRILAAEEDHPDDPQQP